MNLKGLTIAPWLHLQSPWTSNWELREELIDQVKLQNIEGS